MFFLKPTYIFDKVWDISVDFLKENDIKCVLLDVDNTLTTHNNPKAHELSISWLDSLKSEGIIPLIISNNVEKRVSPFAKSLGIDFVCHAQKPMNKGVNEAVYKTGISKNQMLIIGDQIFTDVLCGKNAKIKTALVIPFELEDMPFFKVKRFFEKIILRKERKNERIIWPCRKR